MCPRSRTVGVVDDDAAFRALIRSALEAQGLVVVEAGTAAEADVAVNTHHPALVLVDGLLPDASGVEWIARRRRLGDKTRIGFVSAYWRDAGSHARLTRDLHVEFVLHKPVDPVALAATVKAQLGGGRPESDALGDVLTKLRADYAGRLPLRIEEAATALDDAWKIGSRETTTRAAGLAHKLRGTAGSYGFHRVSRAFGQVEDLLRALDSASPAAQVQAAWTQIHDAINEARAASPPSRSEAASASVSVGMPPGRVLVVDDDPDFLCLVAAVASRSTIEVIPAASAAEALGIARILPVDAVILDVNLLGEPSFPVARQLRFLTGRDQLPIAFASADTTIETRAAAAHAGAVRFLSKPVEPEVLLELAAELVSLARRNRSRVLIVDDDPDFLAHATSMLSHADIEIRQARDADSAIAELDLFRPDLILADVFLGGVSGLDLCRTIRLSGRWDDIPIILATANPDRSTLIEGFRAGCDDYLTKPVVREELLARVRVRLDRGHLLRRASEIDPTTGLMVRRAFARSFNAALQDARRNERTLTVALLDLDRFKAVNDAQGHLAGDRVLEGVGTLMRRSFRVYDIVGRWGGEELVVAFPGETRAVGSVVVQRLLAETSALVFEGEQGPFSVSFTAGVATFPEDGGTVEAMMAVADRRLYEGKHQGRARVVSEG